MNEKEFDQKIRENAILHESRIEKPLWNKNGTWSRIESGLKKKNRVIWWKVAAIILLFLSAGWTYAQWNDFRKFRSDKELELSEIQHELHQCTVNKDSQVHEVQIIISRQNVEIDSLKKQMQWMGEMSRKRIIRRQELVKNIVAENPADPLDQKKLIDSLQNQLRLAKKLNNESELARLAKEKNPEKPEIQKVPNVVSPESDIYYISSSIEPQNIKKGKGFKIGFFGLSREENIEYKSDHSIFKK